MPVSPRDLRLQVFGPGSGEVGYAYFLEGDILDKAGDHEAAIDTFSAALQNFRRQSDPIWTAFAQEWLADSHRKLGNYDTAEDYAARAADTVQLVLITPGRVGHLRLPISARSSATRVTRARRWRRSSARWRPLFGTRRWRGISRSTT